MKKSLGMAQWNKEGIKYYERAKAKYMLTYKDSKMMRKLYMGWEEWLLTKKDGEEESRRMMFHSIMGTVFAEDNNCSNEGKKKQGLNNDSDPEDDIDGEDEYYSDTGTNNCTWRRPTSHSQSSMANEEENEAEKVDRQIRNFLQRTTSPSQSSTASIEENEQELDKQLLVGRGDKTRKRTSPGTRVRKNTPIDDVACNSPARNTRGTKKQKFNR